MGELEIRCPNGPRKLFAKVISEGGAPSYTDDGSLIELSCSECKRGLRGKGRRVFRVLHRYNILGQHVETVVEYE